MTILQIDRSVPFDPTVFLGDGWTVVEQDESSLKLVEVEIDKIMLPVYFSSREAFPQVCLDANAFQAFWENKPLIPESWKKEAFPYFTRVYFEGTYLRHERKGQGNMFLCWDHDNIWHFGCNHQSRCFSFTPGAVLPV